MAKQKMRFYTIGYGGRRPEDFVNLLKQNSIKTVVDVRLYPSSGGLGIYKRAKDPDEGIQGLLSAVGIGYVSLIELGNIFLNHENWHELYEQFTNQAGDMLTGCLMNALKLHPEPYCLMCCEKDAAKCHRMIIADNLVRQGHEVKHI